MCSNIFELSLLLAFPLLLSNFFKLVTVSNFEILGGLRMMWFVEECVVRGRGKQRGERMKVEDLHEYKFFES